MGIQEKLGRGSKALLLLAAAVIVLVGLKLSASVVVPVTLAAFVAAATSPFVRWLHRHGIPRGFAVLFVILGVLAVLAGLGFVITSAFVDLNDALPTYMAELTSAKRGAAAWLADHGMNRAARSLAVFDIGDWLSDAITTVIVEGGPSFLSSFGIVILVVVFILLEAATFERKAFWARQAGGVNLRHLRQTVHEVQKYLGVKSAISLATGLLCGIWCVVFNVEHALLWGVLAFVLNYIPNVGSAVAAVPPVVVALAQQGVGIAATILIGYIVINTILGNILEPKVMGRALGLSPLVVVLSMIVWGFVLGPIGAVLSAPLTMIVKIVLMHTEDLRWVAVLLAPVRSDEWHARNSVTPPAPARTLTHHGSTP